jgi:hypothetical protein
MYCISSTVGVPNGNDLELDAVFERTTIQQFNTNSFPQGAYDLSRIVELVTSGTDVWIAGGGAGQGWKIKDSPLPTITYNVVTGIDQLNCTLVDVNSFSFIADGLGQGGMPYVYDVNNAVYYMSVEFGTNGMPIFTNSYGRFTDSLIMPQIPMDFYSRFQPSGGSGTSTNSVYIIKVALSATGTITGTPFTSRDPSGNDLVANGWTLNILSTTSFSAVYPSSFTGTFTNFRRFVATTSAGTTYSVSNMSVASSTGQTCRFDPATQTLTFSGFTNAFAGIVTTASTNLYVAFEYIPQTIIF